jgi:hypothetical protein
MIGLTHKQASKSAFKLIPGLLLMLSGVVLNTACASSPLSSSSAESIDQSIVIDTSSITVSGLSSGGYMATQFHFSYPELVSGAGIIAAGPYNCARNSLMTALAQCIDKAPDHYPSSVKEIRTTLPNISDALKDDKVWLLHGTLDTKINAKASDALHAQYAQFIKPTNLRYVNDKPFAHLFPTLTSGGNCEQSTSPFIGKCDYDAAGEMLSFMMPAIQQKASATDTQSNGELIIISQNTLNQGLDVTTAGMNEQGFVYLPNSCRIGQACKVHISFHGCNQSVDNVGDQYALNTGLNEWAVNNNLIVLYPQIAKSNFSPLNPQACWDWWGYTSENYLNSNGKQIQAVHQMLFSLADYLNKQIK